MYRPKGMRKKTNPCVNCFHDNRQLAGDLRADTFCERCTQGDDYRLYEAGADAMLEGLKKEALYSNDSEKMVCKAGVNSKSMLLATGMRKGHLVFIPDEE